MEKMIQRHHVTKYLADYTITIEHDLDSRKIQLGETTLICGSQNRNNTAA